MTAFTCPFCNSASHYPKDAEERYCAVCHVFVDDVLRAEPHIRRTMAAHYRRLGQEQTARAWELGIANSENGR